MDFNELKGNFDINPDFKKSKSLKSDSSSDKNKIGNEEPQNTKQAPVDPKYWQSITFKGKEKTEYGAFFEQFYNDKEDTGLKISDFSENAKKTVYELIQNKKLSEETFLNFVSRVYTYGFEKEEVDEVLEILKNGDDSLSHFFENILSKHFTLNNCHIPDIKKLLVYENPVKYEFADFMVQAGQRADDAVFGASILCLEALETLDETNFEDYKKHFEKCCMNESPNMAYYHIGRNYTNPVTGLYDCDIAKETETMLEKENKSKITRYSFCYSNLNESCAAQILKEGIDKKTGKISPDVLEFIDKYYFQIESKSSKIKSLIKKPLSKIKNFNKGTPLYEDINAGLLPGIVNAMKDNEGSINKTNIEYISKIMESEYSFSMSYELDFFKYIKNEEGIIDKDKFNFALQILKKTENFKTTNEILAIYDKLGMKKADKIYKCIKNTYKKAYNRDSDTMTAEWNFSIIAKGCFDEKGNIIEENWNFMRQLIEEKDFENIYLPYNFFDILKSNDGKELFEWTINNRNITDECLLNFIEMLNKYTDEEGNFDPFIKGKLKLFAQEAELPLSYFDYFIETCSKDKEKFPTKKYNESFDDELFYNMVNLSRTINNCGINGTDLFRDYIGKKEFALLVKGELNADNIGFKTKINLYEILSKLNLDDIEDKYLASILKNTFYDIDKSLSDDNISLPVDEISKQEFITSVLSSGKQNGELSEFEQTMKNSIPLLKSMKNGIPLKYSREKFLSDLSFVCNSEEKIKILAEKTNIKPVYENSDDKIRITGYEGIITPYNLNKDDPFENKLYETINKFLYKNKAVTGNSKLDTELNKILKAAPEFINTIGKVQHKTQEYTLDVHQLLVLANSIDNPDYKKLNNVDKTMLKLSCIFHDISKQEGVVDEGHQISSALYTRGMVKKFFNNPESIERVCELIKNHHWLKEYATASDKDEAAKLIAFKFRRPNDFDIAKIMAKSDLMAVSDDFYEVHKDALNKNEIQPVEDRLIELYSKGSAVFSDYFINKSLLENHKESYKGKEYRVVNFHNIKNNESLKEYGFEDVKKEDAKLLVHMIPDDDIRKYLERIKQLTNSVNGGVLSQSLITPSYKRTYCNRKYGVLLSQINPNIVSVSEVNQGSGCEKEMNRVMELIYSPYFSNQRENFKTKLFENLNIDKNSVTDAEYAKFYKDVLASKTSLSNFVDSAEYKIGKKTVKGSEIKKAIANYQNGLIDKKEKEHNEIVGYVPKIQGVIAKAKSLDDVPVELLDFADKYNLPVVLI